MKRLFLLGIGLLAVLNLSAEENSIKEIYANPTKYEGKLVTISGLVTQFVKENENSTSHYLLKDDYGSQIRIVTAKGSPETYSKYKVTGIVYFDQKSRSTFLTETERVEVSGSKAKKSLLEVEEDKKVNWIQLLIVVMGVIAIRLVLMKYTENKKAKKLAYESENRGSASPMQDFQTIKITPGGEESKTIKFIPGELQIITGKDKGKSFKMSAYPTSEGNIVTIGRGEVTGPRSHAHIRLMEQTVSREQAHIIQKGKKLSVKNVSKTNFTTVDGVELKLDEVAEIKPGSTIKTGEVEFKYILQL